MNKSQRFPTRVIGELEYIHTYLTMKLNLALIALNGVLGGRNPMNHLDSVFGVANDFVSTFEGDYPNIKGASRQKQYTKAVSNLTRIWNRLVE